MLWMRPQCMQQECSDVHSVVLIQTQPQHPHRDYPRRPKKSYGGGVSDERGTPANRRYGGRVGPRRARAVASSPVHAAPHVCRDVASTVLILTAAAHPHRECISRSRCHVSNICTQRQHERPQKGLHPTYACYPKQR